MSRENKKHLHAIKESFGLDFDPDLFLLEIKRVLKKFNAYIFTNKNLLLKYITFAEDNDYTWNILIWTKPNPVPIHNNHYLFDKEYCIFIREKGCFFNSELGYENYFTVFEYPIGNNETEHPTEKPIKFIRRIIKISSKENDLVLDPFMGSGTSALACKGLNRNFIGFEINPDYCKIANKRLSQENISSFF